MATSKVKFARLGKEPPTGKPDGTPFGTCNKKTGMITIDPRQSEEELLDTLIHEVLHSSYPFLEEDVIHKGGNAVSDVLWKLGYRRVRQ
jgi:hypothetical protein